MHDIGYFDVAGNCFDLSAPRPSVSSTSQALCNVAARDASLGVLRDCDVGTARPDELAERLLALLVGVEDAHRIDVVKGFLRPIQKRIEQSRSQR